ncbi:MAG: hypothetical protein KZQ78_09240 [Candidatus Thiodiazotropha sp. (ex Ustalcina ferruginea)]|nr:hypothetical protein [Candidatus Thiodiazotropha sp. (ex Ustalcina ferruginea)]
MDSNKVNQAIRHLSIRDVRLDNTSANVSEDFDPLFPRTDNIQIQFKSGILRSETIEFESSNTKEKNSFLRARYNCAFRARLVDRAPGNETITDDSLDTEESIKDIVQVSAEFVAYYTMARELEQELIDEFCKFNVGYHVWPYWREYASSIASRLRLPPIIPPLYVIPTFDTGD